MDRFEEDLGKYPFVNITQVKDYLSISSTTNDARLSNVINYATGAIEHYIGQPVLANDYTEVFDGGTSAVYVSNLPLNNVYQLSEFDGVEYDILDDPSTVGTPIPNKNDGATLTFHDGAHISKKGKKFGKSSLKLDGSGDVVIAGTVSSQLKLEEENFTIEAFVRVDEATLQDNAIFTINTDASNYMEFRLANQKGLAFEVNSSGTATTIEGANTSVEGQNFTKKQFAHVAISRDYITERVRLFYDGSEVANAALTTANLTFTTNVEIGRNSFGTSTNDFKGFIDELRVSNKNRYDANFTAPSNRFRPDEDTVLLVHFDGKQGDTEAKDVHAKPNEYMYSRDTGRITRDVGDQGVLGNYPSVRNNYPALTLGGPPKFMPYPNGVKVEYRAGYESGSVPYDLQLATLDYIKLIYKQDQDKKGFSFEGERGDRYNLSGNLPPHIRRILDLYRILD
tara:strand:+ start:7898 stop:9256 length:1359 start_codon:yes stop_codon:yes gene_type:complete